LEAEAGVKPRSPKGRAQRAGLTPASASNTLSCQWETLHPKLLRSKNPIDSDHGIYGRRDATMILIAFRHGLRPSEVCALRWDMVDLPGGLMHVRLSKNGTPSVQPIGGIELRALRKLKREEIESRFVFMTERSAPITTAGYRKMMSRTGENAEFPFPVHPHMLRHACGYKLANDGQDTRAVQHYLGHRNIQHTVRYTELSPERFKSFWED
jgi:integrase